MQTTGVMSHTVLTGLAGIYVLLAAFVCTVT